MDDLIEEMKALKLKMHIVSVNMKMMQANHELLKEHADELKGASDILGSWIDELKKVNQKEKT